jgi:hypothetical protein
VAPSAPHVDALSCPVPLHAALVPHPFISLDTPTLGDCGRAIEKRKCLIATRTAQLQVEVSSVKTSADWTHGRPHRHVPRARRSTASPSPRIVLRDRLHLPPGGAIGLALSPALLHILAELLGYLALLARFFACHRRSSDRCHC